MKRCPYCSSKDSLFSRPTSGTERFFTRMFLLRHYRCMTCLKRFIGFRKFFRTREPMPSAPRIGTRSTSFSD
jgi:DNA-directed RNA polymerase subunit RPC12/RpoP